MGLLFFFVLGCIAGACILSVQHTVSTIMCRPFNDIMVRNSIDLYVWSEHAPKLLRKRYIIGYYCITLAIISLAYYVATNGLQTNHTKLGVVIAIVMATYLAGNLGWKFYRNG